VEIEGLQRAMGALQKSHETVGKIMALVGKLMDA
jgi:hypothetical protein